MAFRFKSFSCTCHLLAPCGLVFLAATAIHADVPNVLQDADPTFIEGWQPEIEKQIELLSAAYGLDQDAQNNLRTELELRLVLEHEYEAKMMAELDELGRKVQEAGATEDENSPELQELGRRFSELSNGMPLNETQVADWMATRVSPEVAQEGRQRWEELVQRREQYVAASMNEDDRVAGRKADMAAEVREMRSRDSNEYEPRPRGPNGDFVDARTMERAGRPYVNPADIAAAREARGIAPPPRPGAAARHPQQTAQDRSYPTATPGAQVPGAAAADAPGLPRPPEPARLQKSPADGDPSAPPPPAPPLDDWEKHVVSVAQKYGFDSGQNMRAMSILGDLKKRAYHYQLSRSEEYARAQIMTDAKARGDALKHLNAPLDALFAELKQRLESLPTMSQKQRAGAPAPPAKKGR
ncbi:MAG TPA: hypothetical protein VJZ71_04785 [Phycisphaerae bacterium]|nr:hypothetical protein [Phycisphaerae bacterium]